MFNSHSNYAVIEFRNLYFISPYVGGVSGYRPLCPCGCARIRPLITREVGGSLPRQLITSLINHMMERARRSGEGGGRANDAHDQHVFD